MSKPIRNIETTGVVKVKQKNGDIYVIERVSKWDPQKRYMRIIRTKLLGKIVNGQGPMQPTRPRRTKEEMIRQTSIATRQHIGQAQLFDWIERETNIANDLFACFDTGTAQKILTIARYMVANPQVPLVDLEDWQAMHPTPYVGRISENVYGSLFDSLGRNEGPIQDYFQHRAARCPKGATLAFDSTTISTYSYNQDEARIGFNKDHDGLPAIKLLTLYSIDNHEPIAFSKQPGDVSDVTTIANTLKQLSIFDVKSPMVVADNGYYSQVNVTNFIREHVKFLTRAKISLNWVREQIDIHRQELSSYEAAHTEILPVKGICVPVMREISWTRQRKRGDKEQGKVESSQHRLYLHLYRDKGHEALDTLELDNHLKRLEHKITQGDTNLSESEQQDIEKFFTIEKRGRGHTVHVKIKQQAYTKAQEYTGYFALLSNKVNDPVKALQIYRLREKIEECFSILKGDLDSRKPRVWYPDNLRGRQFCQFIALGYICFLRWKIKELKEKLKAEINNPGSKTTKQEIEQLKRLLSWLENRCVRQILKWFDCLEETRVENDSYTRRWSTEMTARDRLFLKMLGIIQE